MTELLEKQIRGLAESHIDSSLVDDFETFLEEGVGLTRDENPQVHFCVYFAAYDPNAGEVFVGHHKKSGLWLFNGGHIDEGETPQETLLRELGEEWGLEIDLDEIGEPRLLTLTEIDNPTKQTCVKHYDIWYFVPVNRNLFKPDDELLSVEFYSMDWLDIDKAREVITDLSTLIAIDRFEEMFGA